jgi:hypothetical protein
LTFEDRHRSTFGKIDYIHFNPVSGKWNLAKDYLDYYYSSAGFYETGVDEFGFLNNLFHG